MLKQAEKCARSFRNLDRSAGDDECLDYATSVFSVRHNSACRTRDCLFSNRKRQWFEMRKSCWSFLDSPDIRQAFTFETWDQIDKTFRSTEPSDAFIDAFMDLLLYINTCPPGTPITVEWNKNLPCYVLTCDIQGFKAFTHLPKNLPFAFGSVTVSHTSLRPWFGPKNTTTFHVPGMEFFATTGVYKNETEWRNPTGTWLRQIIPKGDQLPKFLDEIEKICNEINEDLPGYDYHNDGDSLDGRITVSHKGVHFAATRYSYSAYAAEPMGFEEDELNTDLTKALQSTQVLHISSPCTSAAHKVIISGKSCAHAGRFPSDLNLNISPATAGNAAGQSAPLRRVPGFTEPLNDLVSVARSSPRKSDSVPSPYSAGNHVSLFGNFSRQIIPLSIWYTPTCGTILSLQTPSFYTPGAFDLHPRAASSRITRAEEVVLGASLNAQSQAPDIPGVSLHAASSRYAISLQAQSLAPDIQLVSLRAYMEELSTSFNSQDQAPDDSYAQDRRCVPSTFDISCKGTQVLARLLTKQDILHLFLQPMSQDNAQEPSRHTIAPYFGASRIEFQFCYLLTRFPSQGMVCFHSVDFVDESSKGRQVLARLHTKQVISHFFLQSVSQDSAVMGECAI